MAELFWAYWDASLRFALLALLLLLATPVLKRFVSPRLLCWAWALLLLRLAIPFSLPQGSSIFNWHESIQPSSWTNAIRQGVVEAGWGETILPVFRDQDALVIATKVGFSWENALVLFWALGALVMCLHLASNVWRLHRFFGKAERVQEGEMYQLFKDTMRRVGIHSNVPLLVSDEIKTPGIAGIFNPQVVIPRKCATELSNSELRCVFLHELTHFQRGDLFVHHLLLMVCYMHWYNPLVWLVLKQFKASMEQACDDEVVDSVCIDTAQEYGYTLLQVAEHSMSRRSSPAGALCLLGSRRSGELKERIVRIANPRRMNPFSATIVLGLFGVSFMFAMTGEQEGESEAERLIRLTKISGLNLLPETNGDSDEVKFEYERNDAVSGAWRRISVPEVSKVLDVSEFRGQRIQLKVTLQSDSDLSGDDVVWADIREESGRPLAYVSEISHASSDADDRAYVELRIDLSETARELILDWSNSDSRSVWIEDLEIAIER